jgi:peptide deformylase
MLEIKIAGDPVLRTKAEKVTKFDKKLVHLLKEMAATMYMANGCGLAAPQIGLSKRIVVIDTGEGIIEMINPEIIEKKGSVIGLEGCLSVPQYEGDVERAEFVTVKYQDRKGKEIVEKAEGLFAIAIQHETDHLNGVLFIDKAITLKPKEQV